MKRLVTVALLTIGTLFFLDARVRSANEFYVPKEGFVPDAATACRIAEAVWIPIYGEEHIAREKPFKVRLKGDVWTVTGKDLPDGWKGGVAQADISKRDGRILRVIHDK